MFYAVAIIFVAVWVGYIMARQRNDGTLRENTLEWIRNLALRPLLIFAALGFILSIIVHGAALCGVVLSDRIFWLHFGIFVVFVPGVMLNPRRDVFSNLPKWVGPVIGVLFMYAFLNFFCFASKTPPRGTPKNDPSQPTQAQTMRGVSGHWMLFYAAGFGMIWNALRERREVPATI